MPEGRDADAFRQLVLERFDMSLGTGLGKLKDKIFRIGHLGDFNDLMLAGTLSGVEMGLGPPGNGVQTGRRPGGDGDPRERNAGACGVAPRGSGIRDLR